MTLNMLIGILEQGLIYGIMAMGLLITYRILDFPDLTVDSSFPLGAAVSATLTLQGVAPWLTLLIRKLKRAFCKLCAVRGSDPESYHHARIQVNDYAYVKFLFFVAEIGYITDPDLIRASRGKLLV